MEGRTGSGEARMPLGSVRCLEKSWDRVAFEWSGVGVDRAMELRRAALHDVDVVAIGLVLIGNGNNTSRLSDEQLSKRIQNLQVRTDVDFFRKTEDYSDLDDRQTLHFRLKVECRRRPDAEIERLLREKGLDHERQLSDDERFENARVTTEHLVWNRLGIQDSDEVTLDAAIVPAGVVLVDLRPGERVELDAYAFRHTAREKDRHVRHVPANTFYKELSSDPATGLSVFRVTTTGAAAVGVDEIYRRLMGVLSFELPEIGAPPTTEESSTDSTAPDESEVDGLLKRARRVVFRRRAALAPSSSDRGAT